jgi:hypothetical protein
MDLITAEEVIRRVELYLVTTAAGAARVPARTFAASA